MKRLSVVLLGFVAAVGASSCGPVTGPGATGSPQAPGSSTSVPAGASATPGSATTAPSGAFIAYVKDDDVWLVTVDGSQSTQLTSDGASGAYTDPSVAPDGTIYALRNAGQLYHLDAAGHVIDSPVSLAVLENGAEGLSVAPDGAHLAYVTTGFGTEVDPRFGTPTGTFIYGGTDVVGPNGTSLPGAAMGNLIYPSWAGPSSLVLSDGVAIYFDTVASEPSEWLAVDDGCLIPSDCPSGQEPQANFTRPSVNRSGTVLAYAYQPYFGTAGRRLATIDGAPPTVPTTRCVIEGQEDFSDPGSFSADGSMFAFDDSAFDPDTFETTAGQGIFVMTVNLDAPDCGMSTARLIGPGGAQPDWGPAGP